MPTLTLEEAWTQFLDFIQDHISAAEFQNWFSPIGVLKATEDELLLSVPNIFVREYISDNYKKELATFFPCDEGGNPLIRFVVEEVKREKKVETPAVAPTPSLSQDDQRRAMKLNTTYTFNTFIEGPSNQFVKSAALGVASRPGKSYNPLFIHGGVGLGKTHLLHSIGHYAQEHHKNLRVQCITTESFINELVDSLRNKSIDKLKRYFRNLDVLLVDDIQFLQSRMNFEDEFCHMFETLINQNKQIVITSDKPPGQLKLSERLIARMEWGLVAKMGVPDLETRVAILQHKAESKGLKLTNSVAFFIAEHIFNNVRQLEGAINRLSAYAGLMNLEVTEDVAEKTLSEMFQFVPQKRITVEGILKSVASMFNVRVSDLRGNSRSKEIAFPRQVAMYLAKELINESLVKLASSFGGKTHSTLLHSWNKIRTQMKDDDLLRRQIQMTKQNLEA